MFTVDVLELRGQMARKGKTITKLSHDVGVDRNTLAAYLKDPTKMPYRVIASLCETLDIQQDKASTIFFAQQLAYTQDRLTQTATKTNSQRNETKGDIHNEHTANL